MSERITALYALRAFEIAARHGSFSKAAQELSVTQSAVSHHVKNLESLFDCELFERHGPRLRLTEQGRLLANELKAGFKIIENACALLKSGRDIVRLKAPSTLTIRWLLRVLDRFRKAGQHSEVQLSSVWMDIDSVDLYAEPYDCAILLGAGHFGADIESCKLFDEWLVPVCRPDYLPAEGVELAQLNSVELLHPSADRRDWRRWLSRVGAQDLVSLERGQLFDTLDQGISAATQGLGISVVDLLLAGQEIADGRLHLPLRQVVATGDAYYLVWLKTSPKARQMRELRDYLLGEAPVIAQEFEEFLQYLK
ncbi:LysR substrate-binding domain-containing protein [Pseudomonas sp. 21LCFQ02]|uniref:LysR substrate-binding domain-containing protein n=1 Tax=Pseudomonas sp. 21LCFQ02 TaxID=2957505 RepID=UPI00209B7178|nr:LysR substrate-binding domain-containing protein [Pseudomonas sp. 21LCFQ02]MCO8170663.1 LysR substrate-binding domain-containing protein [Pseudomonas sp. 21LCFQ02]